MASAFRDRPLDPGSVVLGEVGLGGEVRAVRHAARRVGEAARLGFARLVVPRGNVEEARGAGVEVAGVATLGEALAVLLG